jgi:hypothetical protein
MPWDKVGRIVDELLARSNWTVSPWFLEPRQAKAFEPWGLTFADLEVAARGLAAIYPPEYCRRILDKLQAAIQSHKDTTAQTWLSRLQVVLPLYGAMALIPPVEFIVRGIDADLVRPTLADPELAKRLCDPGEEAGASLELEVWGSLLRAGRRVARFVPAEDCARRPDLIVGGVDGDILVEVKNLRRPEDEVALRGLDIQANVELLTTTTNLPPTLHLEVYLADDVADMNLSKEGRKLLPSAFVTAVSRLIGGIEELERAGWPIEERVLPGAGTLRIRLRAGAEEGSSSGYLLARQDSNFHASRVVRPILQAAKKGKQDLPSLAFIDIPPNMDHGLAATIAEKEMVEQPDKFETLDGFIVRSSRPLQDSVFVTEWIAWIHILPNSRLTKHAIQQVCDDIIRWTRLQPARIDIATNRGP